jgi:hypothetical protein
VIVSTTVAARQVIAFHVCGVLRKLGGFQPRISSDSGRVIVWTGHGADYLEVRDDGKVEKCRPGMNGGEGFPPEWV